MLGGGGLIFRNRREPGHADIQWERIPFESEATIGNGGYLLGTEFTQTKALI